MQGWAKALQKALYILYQHPIYGLFLLEPERIDPGIRNWKGITLLTITPSDLLEKCLLYNPVNLHSASLKVLVPKGGMLPPGDMTPLNWKLRLPPGHFGILNRPLCPNQQAKKEVTVHDGVIDLDYQEEIGLLFHNVGEKEYVWNTEVPCSVIKINGKL